MNNINYDNYETYFLLYADNELSPQERKDVEDFAAESPSLKAELDLLLMTVMPASREIFIDKSVLFKTPGSGNLQEDMLLHLDGELPAPAVQHLDKMLAENEILAEEWSTWQQTKLDTTEKIIFPYKKSLYRERDVRVVYMRWARLAVAAALIGMGFYAGIRFMGNPEIVTPSPQPTATTSVNQADANNSAPAVNSTAVIPEEKKENVISLPKEVPVASYTFAKSNKVVGPEPSKSTTPAAEKDTRVSNIPMALAVAQPKLVTNNPGQPKEKIPEEQIQIRDKEIAAIIKQPKAAPITDQQVVIPVRSQPDTRMAVLDNDLSRNDNHILILDEENVTRSKAGGLLRKIKRVVERNTVLKTGDEIKIAGFSFAVK
ncbi:MAG: hypothetical protein ABIT96_05645 [Ferruginibacter sp.]